MMPSSRSASSPAAVRHSRRAPGRVAQAECGPLPHLEFRELLVEMISPGAPIGSSRVASNRPALPS